MDKVKKAEQEWEDKKSWLEWVVFAISLLLVAGILAYWGYQTYTDVPSSPDIYVEKKADPSPYNPHRYHVVIHNKGGETAETVIVEVALQQDGKDLEKAELEVAFAPKESKREGWVNFNADPASADSVVTRVVSYKKP